MGLLSTILGGGLGKLVRDIVGTFKLTPEARLEFEKELAAHEHVLAAKQLELEGKLAEYQAKEIEAASANIRAEATSGDKFTSRARPTFLYVCYVVIINNYLLVPYLSRTPIDFPEPLFWLMGTVMTGYVASRGWEKVMGKKGM